MTQISYYKTTQELISKTCCKLIEKCYNSTLNTCIVTHNDDFLHEVDKILWTYSQKNFIPHATEHDILPDRQPVYISSSINNPNHATIFVLINPKKDTISDLLLYNSKKKCIQKILILLDEIQQPNIAEINTIISQSDIIPFEINYFEQTTSGTWQKQVVES